MTASFDRRIARAEELAARYPESAGLLDFYRRIARFQGPVFEGLRASGGTDPRCLLPHFSELALLVENEGPEPLGGFARTSLSTPEQRLDLLISYWEHRGSFEPEAQFFARVLMQPFAEYLAGRATLETSSALKSCPFCSSKPVVAVLRGEGEGARRGLICSLCSTEWQFRRLLCPQCDEERPEKLPVYTAAGSEHVRVEACDSCRTYIKSVDLTKDGLAIPVVDELATPALALWADERGYAKLESNILGM